MTKLERETKHEVFCLVNDSDDLLVVYIEPNPDRYKLKPNQEMKIMSNLPKENLTISVNRAGSAELAALTIYLDDFDAWVEVNGGVLEPWV